MSILEDFNLFREDRIYLLALSILVILCFAKLMEFAMSGGILHPDSALYLMSALKYAGMDYYNIVKPKDIYFTPVISFLTALMFRLGITDKMAIVIVTMVISFVGYIGMYILFKRRFNPLLSFLGVVIFGCSSVVIYNMPQGLIDLPSVSLSIWALVFAVSAIDKNPKYFLIAFPLIVIGFFIKYTVGFMIPLILLYYLMRRGFVDNVDLLFSNPGEVKEKLAGYIKSLEFRYIIIASLISVILATVICKTLILDYGAKLTFLTKSFSTFNGHQAYSPAAYNPDKLHYLFEFPVTFSQNRPHGKKFMLVLFFIFAAGLVAYLVNIIKNRDAICQNKRSFKTKYFNVLLIIAFVLLMGLSAYGFLVMANHMVSNIALLAAFTIFFAIIEKYNIHEDDVSFDLVMVAYFIIYFIFLSLYTIKIRRYVIPFVPPFVYMIVWGTNSLVRLIDSGFDDAKSFLNGISDNRRKFSKKANILPAVLIIVLLVSTAVFLAPQEISRDNEYFTAIHDKGFVNDLRDSCDFIKATYPDYHNDTFVSFVHSQRVVKWYLNTNVSHVRDNEQATLDDKNYTFIILNCTQDYDNYHEIYKSGVYTVYHHN